MLFAFATHIQVEQAINMLITMHQLKVLRPHVPNSQLPQHLLMMKIRQYIQPLQQERRISYIPQQLLVVRFLVEFTLLALFFLEKGFCL